MTSDSFWSLWLAGAGAFMWFCTFFFFLCTYVADHPRDKKAFCILCLLSAGAAISAFHYA